MKIGVTFKSKWFKATAKIIAADVYENTMKVRLCSPSGYFWDEVWNYEHTKTGFKNGDYFHVNPNGDKYR